MKRVQGLSGMALALVLIAVTWAQAQSGGGGLKRMVKEQKAPTTIGHALAALQQEHLAYRQDLGIRAQSLFKPGNPLLRVHDSYVAVNATAAGDPVALRAELERMGMTSAATAGSMVSGWLPIGILESLQDVEKLLFVRPAYSLLNSGIAMTQGDAAMRADEVRDSLGVNGFGTTVGVLSDSFNCLGQAAADVTAGDLPAEIAVLDDSGCGSGFPVTDEGRAMLQIVHDMAPGAALAFHTALPGQANYVQGIMDLANVGADIILDDLFYFDEPMFQDGLIAQAIDTVVSLQGVSYFSAAGNAGRNSYESVYREMNIQGDLFHDFDPGAGVDGFQSITIPEGGSVILVLQWDAPFASVSPASGGSPNDLDIYLTDAAITTALAGGVELNIGADPFEAFMYSNPVGSGTSTFNLLINHWDGPPPQRVKYVLYNFAGSINEFATNSSTLVGHANAAGAETIGAAFYLQTPEFGITPPQLEPYSAFGGTGILFDTSGVRLATPGVRQKPELVAPDGVNTTWDYAGSIDVENDGLPNFFGTSAAVAHAGAAAALLRDINPHLTPEAIYQALEGSAADMDNPVTAGFDVGFDYATGFGLIRVDQAAQAVALRDKVGAFSSGTWYLDANGDGLLADGDIQLLYGGTADQPLAGDWNGDGTVTPGVKRGNIYYLRNSNTSGVADVSFIYGGPADTPIVGDWDGDGIDTIGIRRGNSYYLRNANTSGVADITFVYGDPNDTPVVGDWDGDGTDTIGIRRGNSYYLRNSNTSGIADLTFVYGDYGDMPITGDWDGNGTDTVGIYRPALGMFFLRNSNSSGIADFVLNPGMVSGIPLAGNW